MMPMDDAAALHDAADLPAAEAAYRALLADRPGDPEVTVALADVLTDAGRKDEAVPLYQAVIDAHPAEAADAWDGLATIRQEAGDMPGAVIASRAAVRLRGDADDAYRLGYTLEQMGRLDDANAAYELAAEFRPTFAEAHAKVGTWHMRHDRPAAAAARYAAADDAGPNIAEIHSNLAQARRIIGEEDAALKSARRAIDLKPDLAAAHAVLGSILMDRRRPAEALMSLQKAVQLQPDLVDAYDNIGTVLERIGRVPEAAGAFERAVTLNPAVPRFHANLGHNRLLRGDYVGGWPEFDHRRLKAGHPAARTFDGKPMWDGRAVAGRTVLLTAEKRLGDTIQFLRYATLVANTIGAGGRVIVEVQPPLLDLARTVKGVADVVPFGGDLPAFDCHCPLMTLPRAFGTTVDTIPAGEAYLSADPAKVAAWAAKLPPGRRVGLCWAGDPKTAGDRTRTPAPARFKSLADVPGVTWVSLQKDRHAEPPPLDLFDPTADLHDLGDTAAVIANLDLVITVDTSVAHLAGAMGKPVWILLPAVPDWRWLLGRADSPWYPSARLFRQPEPGDWPAVVKDVAAALRT